MGRKINIALGTILFAIGLVGIIIGGFIFPNNVEKLLDKSVTDNIVISSTNHENFISWRDSGINRPKTFRAYFFHITNLDQVLRGEKPVLKEKGPLVYDRISVKYDVSFHSDTVRYKEWTHFLLNRALSSIDPSELITTANLPYHREIARLSNLGYDESYLEASFANDVLQQTNAMLNGPFLANHKKDRLHFFMHDLYRSIRIKSLPIQLRSMYSQLRTDQIPYTLHQLFANLKADWLAPTLTSIYQDIRVRRVHSFLTRVYDAVLHDHVPGVLRRTFNETRVDNVPLVLNDLLIEAKTALIPRVLINVYKQLRIYITPSMLQELFITVSTDFIPTFLGDIYTAIVIDKSPSGNLQDGIQFAQTQWRQGTSELNLENYVSTDFKTGKTQHGFELDPHRTSNDDVVVSITAFYLWNAANPYSFLNEEGFRLWIEAATLNPIAVEKIRTLVMSERCPTLLDCLTYTQAEKIAVWLSKWTHHALMHRNRVIHWLRGTSAADLDPTTDNIDTGFELDLSGNSDIPITTALQLWDSSIGHSFVNETGYRIWLGAIDGNTTSISTLVNTFSLSTSQVNAVANWINTWPDNTVIIARVQKLWATSTCVNGLQVNTNKPCQLLDVDPSTIKLDQGFEVNVDGDPNAVPSLAAAVLLLDQDQEYSFLHPIGYSIWFKAMQESKPHISMLATEISAQAFDPSFGVSHVQNIVYWLSEWVYHPLVHTESLHQWRKATCKDAIIHSVQETYNWTIVDECTAGINSVDLDDVVLSQDSPYSTINRTNLLTTTNCLPLNSTKQIFLFVPEIQQLSMLSPSLFSPTASVEGHFSLNISRMNQSMILYNIPASAPAMISDEGPVSEVQYVRIAFDSAEAQGGKISVVLDFTGILSGVTTVSVPDFEWNATDIKVSLLLTSLIEVIQLGDIFVTRKGNGLEEWQYGYVWEFQFPASRGNIPQLSAQTTQPGATVFAHTVVEGSSIGTVSQSLERKLLQVPWISSVLISKRVREMETHWNVTFVDSVSHGLVNVPEMSFVLANTSISTKIGEIIPTLQVTTLREGVMQPTIVPTIIFNRTQHIQTTNSTVFSCDVVSAAQSPQGLSPGFEINPLGIIDFVLPFQVVEQMWNESSSLSLVNPTGYSLWKSASLGDSDAVLHLSISLGHGTSVDQVGLVSNWLREMTESRFLQQTLLDRWRTRSDPMNLRPLSPTLYYGWEIRYTCNCSAFVSRQAAFILWNSSHPASFLSPTGFSLWLKAYRDKESSAKQEIATMLNPHFTNELGNPITSWSHYHEAIGAWLESWTTNQILIEHVMDWWRYGGSSSTGSLSAEYRLLHAQVDFPIGFKNTSVSNPSSAFHEHNKNLNLSKPLSAEQSHALWDAKKRHSFLHAEGFSRWRESMRNFTIENELLNEIGHGLTIQQLESVRRWVFSWRYHPSLIDDVLLSWLSSGGLQIDVDPVLPGLQTGFELALPNGVAPLTLAHARYLFDPNSRFSLLSAGFVGMLQSVGKEKRHVSGTRAWEYAFQGQNPRHVIVAQSSDLEIPIVQYAAQSADPIIIEWIHNETITNPCNPPPNIHIYLRVLHIVLPVTLPVDDNLRIQYSGETNGEDYVAFVELSLQSIESPANLASQLEQSHLSLVSSVNFTSAQVQVLDGTNETHIVLSLSLSALSPLEHVSVSIVDSVDVSKEVNSVNWISPLTQELVPDGPICAPPNGLSPTQVQQVAKWLIAWETNPTLIRHVLRKWRGFRPPHWFEPFGENILDEDIQQTATDLVPYAVSGFPMQTRRGFELCVLLPNHCAPNGEHIPDHVAMDLWDPSSPISFLHRRGLMLWKKAFEGLAPWTGLDEAERETITSDDVILDYISETTNTVPICPPPRIRVDVYVNENASSSIIGPILVFESHDSYQNSSGTIEVVTKITLDQGQSSILNSTVHTTLTWMCENPNGLIPTQSQALAYWIFHWADHPLTLSWIQLQWRSANPSHYIDLQLNTAGLQPGWELSWVLPGESMLLDSTAIALLRAGQWSQVLIPNIGNFHKTNKPTLLPQKPIHAQSHTFNISAAVASQLWNHSSPISFLNPQGFKRWVEAMFHSKAWIVQYNLEPASNWQTLVQDVITLAQHAEEHPDALTPTSTFASSNQAFETISAWLRGMIVHPILTNWVQHRWRTGDIWQYNQWNASVLLAPSNEYTTSLEQLGFCWDLLPEEDVGPEFTAVSVATHGCQSGFEPVDYAEIMPNDWSPSATATLWDATLPYSILHRDGWIAWMTLLRSCGSSHFAIANGTAETRIPLCSLENDRFNSIAASDARNFLAQGMSVPLNVIDNLANHWLKNWLDHPLFRGYLVDEVHDCCQATSIAHLPYVQFGTGILTNRSAVSTTTEASVKSLFFRQHTRVWVAESGVVEIPKPSPSRHPMIDTENKLLAPIEMSAFCTLGFSSSPKPHEDFAPCQVNTMPLHASMAILDQLGNSSSSLIQAGELVGFAKQGTLRILDIIKRKASVSELGITHEQAEITASFIRYLSTRYVWEPVVLKTNESLSGKPLGGYFTTQTAQALLFTGYSDPLWSRWNELNLFPPYLSHSSVEYPNFSLFENRTWIQSQKYDNHSTLYMGVAEPYHENLWRIGQYFEWKGKQYIDLWGSGNKVSGSRGEQFIPNLSGKYEGREIPLALELELWNPESQRIFTLKYVRDTTRFGVDVRRYRLDRTELFPQNSDRDSPLNMIDLRKAHFGVPIYLGYPHFLNGVSQDIRSGVVGLEPSPPIHETIFDIEPISGKSLNSRLRLQWNVQINPSATWQSKIKSTYLPMIWTEDSFETDFQDVEDFKQDVIFPLSLGRRIPIASFFGGAVLLIISFVLCFLEIRVSAPIAPIDIEDPQKTKSIPEASKADELGVAQRVRGDL